MLPIGPPSFHQPNPPRRSSLKPLAQGRRRPRKPSASHLELVPPNRPRSGPDGVRQTRQLTKTAGGSHGSSGGELNETERAGARGGGQISALPDERRGGGERGDGDGEERWVRRGRRRRIRDRSLGFDSAVALVRGRNRG